ncbi:uncharacterized protein BO97DRAFT_41099 [Aspergillus homomorphus CBS 101889]|uniref:Uncharacterized protein n=1 Tax=Aspergillus homomorphus (strain CBS 101889) TaxID=1450537 RepID=A0A395I0R5_ASPHC|nr:hypothetical protein BO97DRAFT_41099 [Aspergillus homomorphus CBS 101889]RAL13517.1 hypothetical protein BO97DRAFT_41099 [Aspergillus homomorphus CBS 101889]
MNTVSLFLGRASVTENIAVGIENIENKSISLVAHTAHDVSCVHIPGFHRLIGGCSFCARRDSPRKVPTGQNKRGPNLRSHSGSIRPALSSPRQTRLGIPTHRVSTTVNESLNVQSPPALIQIHYYPCRETQNVYQPAPRCLNLKVPLGKHGTHEAHRRGCLPLAPWSSLEMEMEMEMEMEESIIATCRRLPRIPDIVSLE